MKGSPVAQLPFDRIYPAAAQVLGQMDDDAWAQLEGLVGRLINHQGTFGYWYEGRRISENPFPGGYAGRGALMREAMTFISDHGLLLEGFAWFDWWSNEGEPLLEGDAVCSAEELSPEQALRLITCITHGDRFAEGALLRYFDNRSMPRLLARIASFRPDPIWRGVLRGCAYGDAWGNRNEFRSYTMLVYDDVRGPGLPAHLVVTDDTQMTLSFARALNGASRKTDSELRNDIIDEFVLWLDETDSSRTPGMTCVEAVANLAKGLAWTAATVAASDGCGTVMRVSPAAFLPEGRWQPVASWQAAITHGAAAGIAGSLLTAAIIRSAAEANLTAGRVTAAALELAAEPSLRRNVTQWLVGHPLAEELADLDRFLDGGFATVRDCLQRAQAAIARFQRDPWGEDPCAYAGEGWRAQQTLATALLCVDALADEPIDALRRATVTGGDSDSIAAVAGSILGALHRNPWPPDWFDRLEPRYKEWIAEAELYDFDSD